MIRRGSFDDLKRPCLPTSDTKSSVVPLASSQIQALIMTRKEAALAASFEEQANRFDVALKPQRRLRAMPASPMP